MSNIIDFNEVISQRKGHHMLSRFEKIVLAQIVRLTMGVRGNTLYRITIENEEIELWDEPEVINHLKDLGYLVQAPDSDKLIVPMSRYDECFDMLK